MKLIGLIFLFSLNSFALTLENQWNLKFQKELVVSCDESEVYLCTELCEDEKKCVVKEEVCRDCVANTAQMSDIFRNMGRTYTNSESEADLRDVVELIKSGKFVTITSKSLYNLSFEFDAFEIRQGFQSLCKGVAYPVVVFDKLENGSIGNVQFVGCDKNAYIMDHDGGVNSTVTSDLY